MAETQEIIEITSVMDVVRYTNGLRAIIFDMDDTLYSEKEYVRSGYRKIAELFPQIEDAEGQLWKFFIEGRPAIDELLKRNNLFSEENKAKCLSIYRLQKPDIHLYDGVKEMIEDLGKKFLIGLITDGRPEGQRKKIEALKIESLVDEIIITDELGGKKFRKPNPMAFQMMSQRFRIRYEQSCYVGDNIQKDFVAPGLLGIKSIWFKNPEGLYL